MEICPRRDDQGLSAAGSSDRLLAVHAKAPPSRRLVISTMHAGAVPDQQLDPVRQPDEEHQGRAGGPVKIQYPRARSGYRVPAAAPGARALGSQPVISSGALPDRSARRPRLSTLKGFRAYQ